jgi:hypothetical protein
VGVLIAMAVVLFCAFQLRSVRAKTVAVLRTLRPREACGLVVIAMCIVTSWILLCGFVRDQDASATGEPFFWVEGISIWPTVLLRIAAAGVSLLGIAKVVVDLRRLEDGIDFKVDTNGRASRLRPRSHSSIQILVGSTSHSLESTHVAIWRLPIELLRTPTPDSRQLVETTEREQRDPNVAPAWDEYKRRNRRRTLALQAGWRALLYYGLIGALFATLGGDIIPVRGESAFIVERATLFVSVVLMTFLIFLVLRAASVAKRFIEAAGKHGLDDWPSARVGEFARSRGMPRTEASRVLAVHLAHRIASTVSRFVWFPAVSSSLLIVSRSGLFDRWCWPPALIITFGACFLLLLISARELRDAAHALRADALRHLHVARIENLKDDLFTKRIAIELDDLRSMRSGVFAPVLEHRLLHAGLLPVLGISLNAMIETVMPLVLRST